MQVINGKLVVLGHQGVGKTSTVLRYVEKIFSTETPSTVGASFFTCKIDIEGILVKLQVWDTAGQERFKSMTPMFYRNSNAALLVFDLSQRDTLEHMKMWASELKRNIDKPILLCVVGNKTDLDQERQVSREEALQYSHSIGAKYFECSAKEDMGIEQIFLAIARDIIHSSDENAATSLQRLESFDENALLASASEMHPTDIGHTEVVGASISSIAHGDVVGKSKCC